jgi:glycosyltransferase involved in cell wall biosynthesis
MMNNNDCKVSVIIPVYNTEDYVRQSVLSACNQTLNEIEIICVNDGSTDNSHEVLAELAKEDKRIQIIEKTNSGQSDARNTGIKYASGKYLYFLDSDDVIDNDTLEICYTVCERDNDDFVTFDSDIYNPENVPVGNSLRYDRSSTLQENKIYRGIDAFNLQLSHYVYTPSVPLLFIRTTFIENYHLSFFSGIIHEDQLFTTLLYLKAERMSYMQRQLFHRRIRSDSTMTKKISWKNVVGYFTVADELNKEKENSSEEQIAAIDMHLSQILNAFIRWEAYKLCLKQRLKVFYICLLRYKKHIASRSLLYLLVKPLLKRD